DQELAFLSRQVKLWLENNPDSTVAILCFLNKRASEIINHLKREKIEVSDMLMKVPEPTRLSAGMIVLILKSLYDPLNRGHLARCFEVFYRHYQENPDLYRMVKATSLLIRLLETTEDYLYPDGNDWLQELEADELNPGSLGMLKDFRAIVQRWHAAMILPLDQLVLVIAQDLVLEKSELAIIHKLSGFIKSLLENNPHWSEMDVMDELIGISKNYRGFATFSQEEGSLDPDNYRGKVMVATVHKSKGLEWDKVFLSSANNFDYPSGDASEVYTSERWFIVDRRNLEAELFYDLDSLEIEHIGGVMLRQYDKQNARDEIVRDRLRLFYVGMTRARQSLTISWNTGTRNNLNISLPLKYLSDLEKENG
ncbi:MAG: 3'-5' exonuclease, partial [Anaerolineaceae bacterium]